MKFNILEKKSKTNYCKLHLNKERRFHHFIKPKFQNKTINFYKIQIDINFLKVFINVYKCFSTADLIILKVLVNI